MVVARVQTVVPLCKISVPDGSVKATCQSLSFDMFRSLSNGEMEERALTYFCPFESRCRLSK
jgi:hypothetical protein